MVQYKKKDPYCFILDQGLQYRRVGEVEKTYRIVIGKEIALFTDKNPYHLDKNNPYTEMYQDDIHTYRIKKKDKMDINEFEKAREYKRDFERREGSKIK